MKIYWEILILVSIFLVVIGWFLWDKITYYFAVRRYKSENDKSRRPEDYNGRTNTRAEISNSSTEGNIEGRSDIQATGVVGTSENKRIIRNPFKRF